MSSPALNDEGPLNAAEEREGDRCHPSSGTEISSEVLEKLQEEFQTELRGIEAVVEGNFSARVRPSCQGIRVDGALLAAVDDLIAREWEECSEMRVWKLNCLVYAGAVVVGKFVKRSFVRPGGGGCPRVKTIRRKEAEVTELRRKIGWLTSEISRRKTSPKMTDRLCRNQARVRRIFGPQSLREMEARLETLKGYLRVRSLQLRRLKKTLRRKKLNEQYRRLGPRILEKQNGAFSTVFAQPSADQVTEYWNGVLGSQVPIVWKILLCVRGRKKFGRFPLQPGVSRTLQFGCQL